MEDLSPVERRLWAAFPKGESVDLSSGDPAFDDVGQAEHWGRGRTVRAEVLVALLVVAAGLVLGLTVAAGATRALSRE